MVLLNLNFLLQANTLSSETAMKQVAQYTKIVSHVFEMVSKAREEWEVESSSRAGMYLLVYFVIFVDLQALIKLY